MLVIIAAIVILGAGLMFLRRQGGNEVGIKSVPGPRAWPIIGNTHQVDKTKFHVTMMEWGRKYGDLFQFNMLGTRYLMLNSIELLESGMETFPWRPFHINRTINYEGRGISFANNDLVIREAKRAANAIAADDVMTELFDQELKYLINVLKAHEGNDVDLNAEMENAVSRFMLTMTIGQRPKEEDEVALRSYLAQVRVLFRGGRHFVMSAMPWLRFLPGPFKTTFDNMQAKLISMIGTFVSNFANGGGSGRGLIEIMLERKAELNVEGTGVSLSEENVYAAAVDCINGSVGPWFNTLLTVLLCILAHDDVQTKIHAELSQVCPTSSPNMGDRDRMPYLQAAILEGLRYISVLTTTVPHVATQDTAFHGYLVPTGTHVFGCMGNLHHADTTWGDGWNFRPDRFLDADGDLLPKSHRLRQHVRPFGHGPRMCTGYAVAERYTFKYIATILYYFKLRAPAVGRVPDCDPRNFSFAGALVVPPVMCRLETRHGRHV